MAPCQTTDTSAAPTNPSRKRKSAESSDQGNDSYVHKKFRKHTNTSNGNPAENRQVQPVIDAQRRIERDSAHPQVDVNQDKQNYEREGNGDETVIANITQEGRKGIKIHQSLHQAFREMSSVQNDTQKREINQKVFTLVCKMYNDDGSEAPPSPASKADAKEKTVKLLEPYTTASNLASSIIMSMLDQKENSSELVREEKKLAKSDVNKSESKRPAPPSASPIRGNLPSSVATNISLKDINLSPGHPSADRRRYAQSTGPYPRPYAAGGLHESALGRQQRHPPQPPPKPEVTPPKSAVPRVPASRVEILPGSPPKVARKSSSVSRHRSVAADERSSQHPVTMYREKPRAATLKSSAPSDTSNTAPVHNSTRCHPSQVLDGRFHQYLAMTGRMRSVADSTAMANAAYMSRLSQVYPGQRSPYHPWHGAQVASRIPVGGSHGLDNSYTTLYR